jgi:hypothetical protein
MWFASTQPPYGTLMPQSGRRPQHHSRLVPPVAPTGSCPLRFVSDLISPRQRHVAKCHLRKSLKSPTPPATPFAQPESHVAANGRQAPLQPWARRAHQRGVLGLITNQKRAKFLQRPLLSLRSVLRFYQFALFGDRQHSHILDADALINILDMHRAACSNHSAADAD